MRVWRRDDQISRLQSRLYKQSRGSEKADRNRGASFCARRIAVPRPLRPSDQAKEENDMSRMPGFTAEAALFERAWSHYCGAGVARPSGTVKPAFRFATDPHLLDVESFFCCLRCGEGDTCVQAWGSCLCIPPSPPIRGGSTNPRVSGAEFLLCCLNCWSAGENCIHSDLFGTGCACTEY
jgi:hypothetical protein